MIKKLLVVIAILVSAISVKAQSSVGDWKLHPNFDYYFKDVIDADDRTYIQALSQGQRCHFFLCMLRKQMNCFRIIAETIYRKI